MLYCPKCQVVSRDGKTCPSCFGKRLREVRPDDPVLLLTADEVTAGSVKTAFDNNEILYEDRPCGVGSVSCSILGRTRTNYRIFVPYGDIPRCREILQSVGVLDEQGNKVSAGCPVEEQKEKPMSRAKRLLIRILSVILFILLIWLAVTAADALVGLVKSVF